MGKLTCIDAFCGAGGMSLGLQQAGFDVRLAFDFNEEALATHEANLGGRAELLDATKVTGADLLALANLHAGELDLLVGGPPCQGFSRQTKGAHLGDERNRLVLEFMRLVDQLKPRAFLLENVPLLAGVRGRHLLDQFSELDTYQLHEHRVIAADYGVAQTRERVLVVGVRGAAFHAPEPTTPV